MSAIMIIDEAVNNNCWNPYESYWKICVGCGCCSKDKKERYKARYELCKRIIEERGGHFGENGLWEPYKGLGYCFVAEWINRHGNLKIWYPNREYYLKQLPEECWRYLE